MSIGRRLWDMARSELNSLLDVAARHNPDDDHGDSGDDRASLYGYTESELREELERRRKARDEVEEAIHGRRWPDPGSESGSQQKRGGSGQGSQSRARPSAAPAGDALRLQKAYAALEVPAGSDFEAVRKSYRALMRKYHPDRHTGSPEKQRAANEVAQRLTEAYKLLEKTLRK